MKAVLLRVGIDTGTGGALGPIFPDGSFQFIPIPDRAGVDERTYGNTTGRMGRSLAEYLPATRRPLMAHQSMHVDPEFTTFTYGDPGRPKAVLRRLQPGDLLLFYAGLRPWNDPAPPALYLVGYFEVLLAAWADTLPPVDLWRDFGENFHVRHPAIFDRDRRHLVLVKGGPGSRLLERAVRISERGRDRAGRPLHVLSHDMQQIFGDFEGRIAIQRSTPRWVAPSHVARTVDFVRSLR
jgi:hypothetical protein